LLAYPIELLFITEQGWQFFGLVSLNLNRSGQVCARCGEEFIKHAAQIQFDQLNRVIVGNSLKPVGQL
jgi:hypothetical protein